MYPSTVSTSDATGGAKASNIIALDPFMTQFLVTVACAVTGTVNYTAQFTLDNIQADGYLPANGTWYTITGLSSQTATAVVALNQPVMAVRLLQNSGNGSVSMTVLQTGAGN